MVFALGLGAGAGDIGADGQRTLSLYNIHNKETLTSVYKKDGKYVPEEMQKINWILRDWRKDEATTMAPELIDLLWEIHSELGSREPIHIISGYRSRGTNEMLRRTVGGQASESRHILGKAADVHFPDVPIRMLRYSALIREKGGVGYYPTSAIPFVHVDVDRVRAWPRLPRAELHCCSRAAEPSISRPRATPSPRPTCARRAPSTPSWPSRWRSSTPIVAGRGCQCRPPR